MTDTEREPQLLFEAELLNDPFDSFFSRMGSRGAEEPLVNMPSAQAWYDLVGWGMETGLYTYLIPLEARRGSRVTVNGRSVLMMSSYDYLGLIGNERINQASIEATRKFGTGTGGVRLLTGTLPLHGELDGSLARFLGAEAATSFTSGYSANLSVIPALMGPRDRVILDERAHRSLVDACRLARVPTHRFRHNDLDSLRQVLEDTPKARRTMIVVEGIYSMDGDICPLPGILELKKQFGSFVMLDEAHSFGVLGQGGRGTLEFFRVSPCEVDVITGSLSKAVPSNGGFVAGSRALIVYLQHAGAPFMFSAALSPPTAAAAIEALRVIAEENWRISAVARNAKRLRGGLRDLGFDIGNSESPIVSVRFGSDASAYRTARKLHQLGVFATAVVSPAVPRGNALVRLCATAGHSEADIEEALGAFSRIEWGRGR